MRRIPKPTGSFVVLRLWLGRVANPTRQVTLELSVVGDPAERGFGAIPLLPDDAALPTGADERVGGQEPERKIVARWQTDALELGIPLDPAKVLEFRDLLQPAVARVREALARTAPGGRLSRLAGLASRAWEGLSAAGGKVLDGIEAGDLDLLPRFRMSLPASVGGRLAQLCRQLLREGEPLWLEIMHPAGYLPLVSWEQLIQEQVKIPVLRLAYHPVQPTPPEGPLTVVLCVSATNKGQALAPSQLLEVIRQIQATLPAGSRVEVFADVLHYFGLHRVLSGDGSDGVILHEPPKLELAPGVPADAPQRPVPGEDGVRQEHPWVSWMVRSLNGRAVDIVHWISPGMLFPERGMLMVANHPAGHSSGRKRSSAIRWVSADDIRSFLLSVGAWAAIASSPWQRLSRMGLRLLADDLARSWTGLVALHEPKPRANSGYVADLYRLICSSEVRTLPATRRLRVYCHPAVTGHAATCPELQLDPEVERSWSRLQEAEADLRRAGKVKVWVASTRRNLEQSISEHLVTKPSSPVEAAEQKGRQEAIAFISKIVAEDIAASAAGGLDA